MHAMHVGVTVPAGSYSLNHLTIPLQMSLSINQQLCHSHAASDATLEDISWLLFCLALTITVLPIVVLQ